MKLAYADPPYLGVSYRYDHPDAAKWDDPAAHIELMRMLDRTYDGWALSASSTSLYALVPGIPSPRARIAAWVKPFAAFKRNVRIAYTWEPVIYVPGRDSSKDGAAVGRDHITASIMMRKGLTGAKPPEVCNWILNLMGYVDGDEVTDLFPGTGIMNKVVAQGRLPI